MTGSFWQYNVSGDVTFMYAASFAAGWFGTLFWTAWVSSSDTIFWIGVRH